MADAVLGWQRTNVAQTHGADDNGVRDAHNISSPTSPITVSRRQHESAVLQGEGLRDGGSLSRAALSSGPGCDPRQGATTFEWNGEVVLNVGHLENAATQQLGKSSERSALALAMANASAHRDSSTRLVKKGFLTGLLKPGVQLERQNSQGSNDSDCSNCSNCSCASAENLKDLRVENAGLRLRVQAVETIVDTHRKTRIELDDANTKTSKLEIAIGNLQSRLHRAGYDTSVDLKEHEIFIPGHDRVFVNSLISENGRIQKELRELKQIRNGKESNANLEKKTKDLQDYISLLENQLEIKESQNQKAEKLLGASDDDKTTHIQQLEDAVSRAHKELKDAEITCNVLTGETKKLQKDLEACQLQLKKTLQELAASKEKAQRFENNYLALQKLDPPSDNNLSLRDRMKIAEGQVEQLDKENTRLTEQLREVIGMNTRWQRYNDQRETYVLKLTKTSKQQQSKVTVLEKQCRELEQTINGLNGMLQNMRDQQRKNTDAAVLSLEQQVAQREDRISELAEELAELKVYIKGSEKERGIKQRKEDLDMIKMLQQQVQVYKDDFEQERKDRERIQGNSEILKDRLHTTTRKLNAVEARYTGALPNYTVKTAVAASAYEQPRRLVARTVQQPAYYLDDGIYEEVEIDGHDETDGLDSNTEPLQCPRCAQEFSVSNHSGFMRHVGVCLDQ